MRAFLTRFIFLDHDALIAIALWICFTYMIDVAEVSPRLAITSPTPRCGKTILLDLLTKLICNPLAASNASGAAIFRALDEEQRSLLIDEFDSMTPGSERFEELRGILNSGHTRTSAFVLRSVQGKRDWVSKKFSTWAAIAVAAIGKLPA